MAAADKKTTYSAAEVAILEDTILKQKQEIDELKRKLEHMNEVFANAQRARFGQSSEKKSYVLEEGQMNFFNEAEDCQDHKAEEPTEDTLTVKAHARKKKRTIDELAKNLPVEEVVFELQESQLTCDKCGGTFKLIGKKLVRRELVIIPQQEKILEYYTPEGANRRGAYREPREPQSRRSAALYQGAEQSHTTRILSAEM